MAAQILSRPRIIQPDWVPERVLMVIYEEAPQAVQEFGEADQN